MLPLLPLFKYHPDNQDIKRGSIFKNTTPSLPLATPFSGYFLSLHKIIANNAVILYLRPVQFLDGDTEVLQGGYVLGF